MKRIYYKKFVSTRKVKVANFKGVSRDWYSKSLPIDFALKQENLKIVNGALIPSMSPKSIELTFDESINKVIPFYDNGTKLFVACSDSNYIIEENNGEIIKTKIEKDCEIIDSTNYKYGEDNFVILATDVGVKKLIGGVIESSDVDLKFSNICNHFYRIFGAEKNSTKLLFSDDFAPFNWEQSIDEGGYINLSFDYGKITDIISFNEYLVVCQEDCFTKITAYSEQDSFVVKTITSPSNIKEGSTVNCGSQVMYATGNGLGIFDGYDCRTICEELAGFLKDSDIESVATSDYCYFLCKDKSSDIKNNYIIAYNLLYRDYHFITENEAEFLVKVKFNGEEKVLIVCDKEIKVLSADINSSNKIWRSGSIDFGNSADFKLLRRIEFGGSTIIDLKIAVDGKNYFFNITNKRSQLLNLKGKEFEIEIAPKGRNINVPSPVIEYSVLEEN